MSSWNCHICSFINHPDLVICEICEGSKLEHEKKQNVIMPPCENAPPSSSSNNNNDKRETFGLLRFCLNSSRLSFRLCSSSVLHYTQRNSFGSTWSCGYRNIQMICSSLQQIPLYRKSLFNCDGCTPDIEEIQRWIEMAWMAGFDVEGAKQLGSLVGGNSWIGATECVALLRFFGVRARIVDFMDENVLKKPLQNSLDTYFFSTSKVGEKRFMDEKWNNMPNKRKGLSGAGADLLKWVSLYFKPACQDENGPVTFSPPVYLQHDGHSRTIIGFTSSADPMIEVESCLVFDPACSAELLQENLSRAACGGSNAKWHRQVKKARDSFNRDQYQIVYVEEGLMSAVEKEESKVVESVHFKTL